MKYVSFIAPFLVLAAIAILLTGRHDPGPSQDATRKFCNEFPPLYLNGILVETYSPTALVQAVRRLMEDTVAAGRREGQRMSERLADESPWALKDDITIYGGTLAILTPAPVKGMPDTDPALTSSYVQMSMRSISRWLVSNCPPRDGWPNL